VVRYRRTVRYRHLCDEIVPKKINPKKFQGYEL